jgi:cation transporter-like permease
MDTQAQFATLASAGLVLVAVGAMLTYAIDLDPDWIDLQVVGTIGLVLGVGCLIAAVVLALASTRPGDDGDPRYAPPIHERSQR